MSVCVCLCVYMRTIVVLITVKYSSLREWEVLDSSDLQEVVFLFVCLLVS